MQKATQQLTNTATLRSTRRDIARAKTILAINNSRAPLSDVRVRQAISDPVSFCGRWPVVG